MTTYIECLRFLYVLSSSLKILSSSKGNNKIFYFDSTIPSIYLVKLANKILRGKFERLNFKMMDIKDENGELVHLRIPRKDLFTIRGKILNHNAFEPIIDVGKSVGNFNNFISKGLINGWMMEKDSISRLLYIINVVHWHKQKFDDTEVKFIINHRPWLDIYSGYASKFCIKLIEGKKRRKNILPAMKNILSGIIKKNTKLYIFIDNLSKNRISSVIKNSQQITLLYLQGRRDVNINNDGNHSDFFWVMNSNFPPKNILYDFHSEVEKNPLKNFGVKPNERKIIYSPIPSYRSRIHPGKHYKSENSEIKKLIYDYNHIRSYWHSFFHTNDVKLFFTWYKYSNRHIAIADAIKDNGGISALWQMAFIGDSYIGDETVSDIIFSHSQYTASLDSHINSKIDYNIITGYPKDYAVPLLESTSHKLKEKLQMNGAKKIIFAIDENSIDDSRWHTGHELQRENYSYVCEKLLEIPWLGVVFKPKNARTLRYRLGPVNELLKAAEATGRCFVFEETGRYTTLASPLQAGLAADVCIHGHLASGTAALECALAGLPTLLIDREGCPTHKLHEMPKDLIVHNNWPNAIEKTIEHFESPKGIPGFGDWSDYIDEFDSFRDGKAAFRMGTYLHWLIQGFEEGLDREMIMADAADRYANEWGSDKIIVA